MVDTAADVVADRAGRGRAGVGLEVLSEAGAVLVSGLRLRRDDLVSALSGFTVGWGRDVRFAVRTLRRAPAFGAVAVLTLGLGIGANGAVFSLVDGILLRPPAYHEPERLVLVWNRLPGSDERIPVSGPDAAEIQESVASFSSIGFALRGLDGSLELSGEAPAQHVRLSAVTPAFFPTLGVEPALGRGFVGDDALSSAGADATLVLISHDLFDRVLGGDPRTVGRSVRLNGRTAIVVGVLPADFMLALSPDAGIPTDIDVWVPLTVPLSSLHRTDGRLLDQDSDNSGVVVGRLAAGASVAQARAEVDAVAARLATEVPSYAQADLGFDVRGLHDDAVSHARPILLALMLGVAGVLLVACLNIATLMIVRGAARDQEFAVRTCLGAGRGRLMRQLLLEGALLVGLGLVVSAGVAHWGLAALSARMPSGLTPPEPLALDARIMVFMAALAGGATLVFALLPALGGRTTAVPGRRLRARTRGRSRGALVAAEVALSVVLVFGAALLVRTVSVLASTDPGFRTEQALAFQVSLRVPDRYRGPGDRAAYAANVQRGLEALPGVTRVGWVGALPLAGDRWTQPFGLPGQAEAEWRRNRADFRVASSGYFEAVGARLLEGRAFTPDEDREEGSRVVIVDEIIARRIAPTGSAIGATIGIPLDGSPVDARVVGVVGTIRYDRLDAAGRGAIYVPYRQEASRDVAFVVKSLDDPGALIPEVSAAVRAVDPGIPPYDLRTMSSYVDREMASRRFALALLLSFACLALICAAIGLYGVVAFEATRKTHDLGLRMAVGAGRSDVVRSVMTTGVRPGAIGLAAGLALGLSVAPLFGHVTYGVDVYDPVAWALVLTGVAAVAAAATLVPALRASRLSPVEALRAE